MHDTSAPQASWTESNAQHSAVWRSPAGHAPPRRIEIADDTTTADAAYRLACEGTALLWRGDFQNARLLLQALARRADRKPSKQDKTATPAEHFHKHRMQQAQRARILGMLLIPMEQGFRIPLRRAPDVTQACAEVWGTTDDVAGIISLRELQGIIGAHEWRKKGVPVAALSAYIHPHYGVFSPVRGEYLDLMAQAPLPAALQTHPVAFDIGTGTGVIAAILARRGVKQVIATDTDSRALACAQDNLARLNMEKRVRVVEADLFPEGTAALAVCNPPWLPGRPGSAIEHAIYDPESRMLKGFLAGVSQHLAPGGEAWLILSDLAEHLGLRSRAELEAWFKDGGLKLIERHNIRPRHPKASDPDDPLHAARKNEMTTLWRLAAI